MRPGKAWLDRTDMDAHARQAGGITRAADDSADTLGRDETRPFLSGQIPDIDDAGGLIHDDRTL